MRTSPVHYIAPSAISIVPNCNNSANDLAVTISRGTKIKVYSPRAGIDKTTSGEYQEWTITGRNRRLADSTKPYTIYARLSALDNSAYLIFAPMTPADDGEYMGLWTQKYSWVTTDGLYVFGKGSDWEEQRTKMNCIFVRLGDVSLPDANNQRTVTLDTGILGTEQFNDEWALRPDELPLRIELGCTINDEDAGPTPYVYWGQSLVLTAMLTEGWTGTDIQRFDHWEITRDSGDSNADNVWNHPTGAGSYHGLTDGEIILTHARGYGDDFNGAMSATFTVVAMGHPEEGSESQNLVALKTAVINIYAETVEKYELAMTANIVGYNPMAQTYDPASITILIRATDQRGDVFELTKGQYDNAGLEVQYAAVGSSGWRTLDFTGASTDVATATLDTATFFAAKQSINVRLMRIVETDDGSTAIELTQQTIAFVRDGEDSKVREWIYRLNSNAGYNSTTGTANGQAVSGQTGGVDNCLLTDDFVPTGWSDDPTGVSQPGDVEWESWRDYDDENHRWGVFHTPVIHNRYAEDGKSITKQSETLTYAVTAASDDHPTADSSDWKSTKSAAITAYNTAHSISGSDWQQDTVMWTKTDILWSDNSHTILYSGERNPDDGQPGMSVVIDSQNVQYSKQAAGNLDPSALTYGAYPASLGKGDWLYSKTTVVYKTSKGDAAGTTVSYSVSYIGTDGDNGVGISGITEHYKASANSTGETTPSGVSPTDWGTNPTPSNPAWDADHPYLWNYEKIAKVDKNGNTTYERTPASVVAIFTKGIDSITNYYLTNNIASGITKQNYQNYQWSTFITPTTEGAPYLWNYEVVAYTDGSTPTMTDPHVIGHFGKDGTSPWIADLDNEMDSVACNTDGHPERVQTVETKVSMFYGNTPKACSIAVFDTVDGGDSYENGVQHDEVVTGVKVTWNDSTGVITAQFDTSADFSSGNIILCIKLTPTEDSTQYRYLYFTVNGIRPGAIGEAATTYRLVPSVSEIIRRKDGTYSPTSLTCYCTSLKAGTATDNPTEATMQYSYSGSSWTTFTRNTSFAASTVYAQTSKKLYLRLLVDGKVMDKETIPVVEDGADNERLWLKPSTQTVSVSKTGVTSPSTFFVKLMRTKGNETNELTAMPYDTAIEVYKDGLEIISFNDISDVNGWFDRFRSGTLSTSDFSDASVMEFRLRARLSMAVYDSISITSVQDGADAPYNEHAYALSRSRTSHADGDLYQVNGARWFPSAPDPRATHPYVWERIMHYTAAGVNDQTSYICLTGAVGAMGKLCYIAGEYREDVEYTSNDSQTVAVEVKGTGETTSIYYLNAESNWPDGTAQSAIGPTDGIVIDGKPVWVLGMSQYNLVRARYLFADFAQFGAAVVSGDWLISVHGTINGTEYHGKYEAPDTYINSGDEKPTYFWFDPIYPNEDHAGKDKVPGSPSEGQWASDHHNFIPNYAVNLLTGKTYQSDAYIRGEVHATSGEFGGVLKKSKTIITAANSSQYIYYDTAFQDNMLDIVKAGTNIVFSDLSESIMIMMPGLYGYISSNYSKNSKDFVRSLIGNVLLLYNYSSKDILITGNTSSQENYGATSFALQPNQACVMECKVRRYVPTSPDDQTFEGYEDVYWLRRVLLIN